MRFIERDRYLAPGANDEPRDPLCWECDDTGMMPCGCTFGGVREASDECLCEGDGVTFCDCCAAGERRAAAWAAKRPDYYRTDYSVPMDDCPF